MTRPAAATPPPGGGLARERTALAWNRSGLAAVVCIAVLLRRVWPIHGEAEKLALGLIAAAAILWALVLVAVITASSHQEGGLAMGRRIFPLMTAGTLRRPPVHDRDAGGDQALLAAKAALRQEVWSALRTAKAARFPGAEGRIPNFTGAEAAADRLQEAPEWKKATTLKANPDSPQ